MTRQLPNQSTSTTIDLDKLIHLYQTGGGSIDAHTLSDILGEASGLNQSEVDIRISTVIPSNRRLPSGGSENQVPTKQSDDSVTWQDQSGGLNQSEVDARITRIIISQNTEPSNPSEGNLWYDTSNDVLNVYDGSSWVTIGSDSGWSVQATAPSGPSDGDGWYDTANDELKIYDGATWEIVGTGITQANADTRYVRHRGTYSNSTTDYALSDVISITISSQLLFFICYDTTLANSNSPSITVNPTTTGWELLTELTHYRGNAPTTSTYYHAGDTVRISTDSSIRLCITAGSYTRATIQTSSNWANLSGGITQSNADSRYVSKTGDTINGTLEITPPSNQEGLRFGRADDSFYFMRIDGNLGGSSARPGIEFSDGINTPDVILHRQAADVLRTPDELSVGELSVDSTGVADTRSNLGLGTAATRNISVQDTAPASPSDEDLWVDTTNNILKVYNGSTWDNLGSAGGGWTVAASAPTSPGRW